MMIYKQINRYKKKCKYNESILGKKFVKNAKLKKF